MNRILRSALFLTALISSPASAQVNVSATPSVIVTITAAPCVMPQGSIQTLFVYNNGSTTVWARPSDGTEPSANALGSVPIPSNSGLFWAAGSAPRNGLDCVSTGGVSDNLTVYVGRI